MPAIEVAPPLEELDELPEPDELPKFDELGGVDDAPLEDDELFRDDSELPNMVPLEDVEGPDEEEPLEDEPPPHPTVNMAIAMQTAHEVRISAPCRAVLLCSLSQC